MPGWQDVVQQDLRERDSDLFLASLFLPEEKRSVIQALYLFAAEVARVPFVVSEPALGEIRLQWWHDTVDAIFHGDAQDNPVAQGLSEAVRAGDLPKHALQDLIKAHQFDLYSDPMPSMNDLEAYLGETQSAVIQMTAAILNFDDALECAEASGLAGVAYGLATLLGALPHWLARHSNFIPADMMRARGLDLTKLRDRQFEAARGVVLAELREHARARLNQARKLAWTIKPSLKPAFLHVALTEPYLERIRKVGTRLSRRPVELAQWRRQWILWKAAKSESF
jgi:15-cis-phytoene synthase